MCSLLTAGGLLVKNADGMKISAEALFNRLSYSHIRELVRLNDDLQRTFYAFEANCKRLWGGELDRRALGMAWRDII